MLSEESDIHFSLGEQADYFEEPSAMFGKHNTKIVSPSSKHSYNKSTLWIPESPFTPLSDGRWLEEISGNHSFISIDNTVTPFGETHENSGFCDTHFAAAEFNPSEAADSFAKSALSNGIHSFGEIPVAQVGTSILDCKALSFSKNEERSCAHPHLKNGRICEGKFAEETQKTLELSSILQTAGGFWSASGEDTSNKCTSPFVGTKLCPEALKQVLSLRSVLSALVLKQGSFLGVGAGPPLIYAANTNYAPTLEDEIRILLYRGKSASVKVALQNITKQILIITSTYEDVCGSQEETTVVHPAENAIIQLKIYKTYDPLLIKTLHLSWSTQEFDVPISVHFVEQSSIRVKKTELEWDITKGAQSFKKLAISNTGEQCELQVCIKDQSNSLFPEFMIQGKTKFFLERAQKISIVVGFQPCQNVENSETAGATTSVGVLLLKARPTRASAETGWFSTPSWKIYEVLLVAKPAQENLPFNPDSFLKGSNLHNFVESSELLSNHTLEQSQIPSNKPCTGETPQEQLHSTDILLVKPCSIVIYNTDLENPSSMDISFEQAVAAHYNHCTELLLVCGRGYDDSQMELDLKTLDFWFDYDHRVLGIRPNQGKLSITETTRIVVTCMLDPAVEWHGNIAVHCAKSCTHIPVHILPASHNHLRPDFGIPIKERTALSEISWTGSVTQLSALSFGSQILEFPPVALGTVCCLKVELQNKSTETTEVTLSEPGLPFIVEHKRIKLKGRSCVYLPVRFVPVTFKEQYESTLVATNRSMRCSLKLLCRQTAQGVS